MAKTVKSKSTEPKAEAPAPAKVNFFKKSASNTANTTQKKPPGTKIVLPTNYEQVNGVAKLDEESLRLNDAITRHKQGKDDSKAAETKLALAAADLKPYLDQKYAELIAVGGVLPETPITVVNHKNESVTWVISDRSQSTGLSDEQLALLGGLVGPAVVEEITVSTEVYSFDAKTMAEIAGELPANASAEELSQLPKVSDIIAEVVSAALANDPRLSDDQKERLIEGKTKVYLRDGELNRIVGHVGQDVGAVKQFIQIIGSALTRYLK